MKCGRLPNFTAVTSLRGNAGFQLWHYGPLPTVGEGRGQTTERRERQPERGHGPVSGFMNEVSANRRCKSAKNCRRQTKRQGKYGGANLRRHDFRKVRDHRSVVHAEEHGEP